MAPAETGGRTATPDLLRDLAGAALAAALSLAIAAFALNLLSWSPSVPLSYTTDAIYYDGVIKATLDHGWYLRNPDIGAPFGLENHDFPVVSNDSLQLLIVKGIGLLTDRPFLVSNIFFVLTFALNAVAAFVALRWRRAPRELAVLGAVAFSVLPLQFMRGSQHLFFVSAYMVPIGCAMVLTVLAGEPLLTTRPGATGLRRLASPRTLVVVLLCAAIASASVYYAVFTTILVGTAGLVRGFVSRSRRSAAEGLAAAVTIGTFVVVNQLPTILYRLRNGPNPVVAVRGAQDAEFYGLKPFQLVLPIPGHRFGPFADLTDRYRNSSYILAEALTSIGLLASIGLGWLLVIALTRVLGPGRRTLGTDEERNAAFAVVVALGWTITGGIATLVSYTVSSQLRTWSRISIFIAFLSISGTIGLLSRLRGRLAAGAGARAFSALVAALVLLVALDQTSTRYAPERAEIEREHAADADFVSRIEDRMPAGATILQLPYIGYPEGDVTFRMGIYDQLRLYLHSDTLRWSFGAMRGRPADWHADVTDNPLLTILAGAVSSGMAGLVVDKFGYVDRAATLEAELTAVMGPPVLVDETDRLAFWDLRSLAEPLERGGFSRDRLAELTVRPIRLVYDDEFYGREADAGVRWRWSKGDSTITVVNPTKEEREVVVSLTLRMARPGTGTTTLHYPDGTRETVDVGPQGAPIQRRLRVAGGSSSLRVESAGAPADNPGDKRTLVVRLLDTVLVPVELCQAAGAIGGFEGDTSCVLSSRAQRP